MFRNFSSGSYVTRVGIWSDKLYSSQFFIYLPPISRAKRVNVDERRRFRLEKEDDELCCPHLLVSKGQVKTNENDGATTRSRVYSICQHPKFNNVENFLVMA